MGSWATEIPLLTELQTCLRVCDPRSGETRQ